MTDQMLRSFKQLSVEQAPLAGGKGRTLARLYRAGYRVPDGFIILPAAFSGDELTGEAWAQVQAQLVRLRRNAIDDSFAVRSSALSEDSATASSLRASWAFPPSSVAGMPACA
jgi:pyruvate,water dikinase